MLGAIIGDMVAVLTSSIRGRGLRRPFLCFLPVPVSRTIR